MPFLKINSLVLTRVANIGQEVQGEFYNAFKVEIKVDPSGKELLPGMTTTNNIVVESIRDAVVVPRLAVFKDSLLGDFVYKREGLNLVKQQIKTNGENDLYYMIHSGLKPGDKVMMKEPVKKDRLAVHHLENRPVYAVLNAPLTELLTWLLIEIKNADFFP